MNRAFIALGTNIEPRKDYLNQAINILDKNESIMVINKSSIYETEPMGYTEQADFLNMVIEVETPLQAMELLLYLQTIEQRLGRKREVRFGPRTIDLDILLYNEENIKMEQLQVPHPRMHERAFVLIPLHEIAPEKNVPCIGKTVHELLNELKENNKKEVVLWIEKGLDEE
ncbi:2-amino-4-hydroxy-6-hydroxymethyldihydropteridine diphosphokinase [Ornithinibacillus halophilus]|nr:2-amino-4-hydroxy-6-hydroxymethyldihydropteridine diphosphokinase [Ornithinibacillus halophilus]